jgi:pimeloyl-ACP methyl ester carboxylesterase
MSDEGQADYWTVERITAESLSILDGAKDLRPGQRLGYLKGRLRGLPIKVCNALEPLVLETERIVRGEARETPRTIVMSLHGIRTRGDWQKHLSPALAAEDFIPKPLDYGFFRAIQLVIPFMRDRKIKWLLEEYTHVMNEWGPHPPSIIAHSFGTYLVARTLQKHAEVKFDRVIFCGSIVEREYPWLTIFTRGQVTRVLNDYGGKDFWAKAAEWVVNDAGPSGAKGFKDTAGGRVVERFRPEFSHSDFFYTLNYANVWIPFLKGVDPPGDVDIPRSAINRRFWIFLVVILILAFLVMGFHLISRLLTHFHR